jgi:hypothetical protein
MFNVIKLHADKQDSKIWYERFFSHRSLGLETSGLHMQFPDQADSLVNAEHRAI